jgi:hypothetical protein
MKYIYKTLGLLAILSFIWGAFSILESSVHPVIRNLAVQQVNNDNSVPIALQNTNGPLTYLPLLGAIFLSILSFRFIFADEYKKIFCKPNAVASIIFAVCMLTLFTGCVRPYDKPEYQDVGNNQTAFVVPLEGDSMAQGKLNSLEFLQSHKVVEKRIQITHRWNPTGRFSDDGDYLPTIRVILVDRAQITRQWDAGTSKNKDNAIWIESADSVGFSMGFSCSAFIKEEDSATYLYYNPSSGLDKVMDSEIRARIQMVAAEVAAKYPLDILRTKKLEIVQAVKDNVVPFFASRGITITNWYVWWHDL